MIDAREPDTQPGPSRGPAARSVMLSPANRQRLEEATEVCRGDPAWRARKRIETHDVLQLSQVAPRGRLAIGLIDLRESIRILLMLETPVPCRPTADGPLAVATSAVIGLTYPREALCASLPGWSFVQIFEPAHVWHPNVGGPGQVLCLGTQLPAGIRTRELILMTYAALSMQAAQIDEGDPAGVLNVEAARWWPQNRGRMPLTATPFFVPTAAAPSSPVPATRHHEKPR
jgi:hypothetical protein